MRSRSSRADRRSARSERRASPRRRTIRRIGLVALAAGVVALVGGVVWAESPMRAEPGPLAAVRADAGIRYSETGDAVVLTPAHPEGTGLVFLAGARVDAPAYASKLSGLADAGVTVVIVKPVLNFAIAEFRSLPTFEDLAPGVRRWYVGGHSLGGVRACQYAADATAAHPVDGLILFGSYCAVDLSHRVLPVLSLGAEHDGLSTPAKIAAARHLLPADAELVQIPGAVHAQFGDYGVQPGDGGPTTTDAAVLRAITRDILAFLG